MRIGIKAKRIIKAVALALAGVAAITAIAFGVKAIVDWSKNDLKEINPSFEVGNLGNDGKYVNDESTLYTKDAFKCEGLQIKLDFDNQINYEVYFYDNLDNLVTKSETLSSSQVFPLKAGYARIVILPTDDEDNKISLTERISYPRQMTVKVNKNQSFQYFATGDMTLMPVENQNLLVFERGSFEIKDNQLYSSTSSTNDNKDAVITHHLLKIKDKRKFTVNETLFSEEMTVFYQLVEFKRVGNVIEYLRKTDGITSEFVIPDDCDYIFIHCYGTKDDSPLDLLSEIGNEGLTQAFTLTK